MNETSQKAAMMMDQLPMGVILLDERHRIQYLNRFSLEILGCGWPDARGKNLAAIFPNVFKEMLDAEDLSDKTLITAIGDERFVATLTGFESAEGKSRMMTLIRANKLDEATRELDSYKNLHADLKAIFDISYDVIYVSDGNGVTLRVSSACERLWGYKEEELVGRSVYDLEKEGVYSPSITRLVLAQKRRVSMVQTTKTKRRLMVIGTPIQDEQGNIIRVVNASRDITEVSQLRSELEEVKQLSEGYRQEVMELRQKSEIEKKIVYRSDKMRKLITMAQKVAAADSAVLIYGEPGAGKEMVASHIHNWSSRKNHPFITLNCGSIPEKLLEMELFGSETDNPDSPFAQMGLFKKAQEGTLYLDEIAEMPLSIQNKLVWLLHENDRSDQRNETHKVRIVASSSKKLEDEVQAGRFREDLFYRLNVIPIQVPPLRERREDIILLLLHFLNFYNKKYRKDKQLSADILEKMQSYPWPGNVRELRNLIERLVVTVDEAMIEPKHLPAYIRDNARETKDIEIHRMIQLKDAFEYVEKELLEMARQKYGSTTRMAEALGVNQSTISRKMQKYGIVAADK